MTITENSTIPWDFGAVTGQPVINGDERAPAMVIVSILTLTCIIVMSIVGNVLVLVAIYREQNLRNKTSVFIANLAVVDLVNAIVCISTFLVSCILDEWIFGDVYCTIIGLLTSLVCLSSINTLGAIALDRYFAIMYPFRYAELMSPRRIAAIIAWIWIQSIVFSLGPIFGWSRFMYIESEYMCATDWSDNVIYTGLVLGINSGIPVTIMAYSYAHILRVASAHRRRVKLQQLNENIVTGHNASESTQARMNRKTMLALARRARQIRNDAKAATTLFIVMGTFLLCWFPQTVTMTCKVIPACAVFPETFYLVSTWFAMLNSACNPFIYGTTNRQFREAFKRSLALILPACWRKRITSRVEPNISITPNINHASMFSPSKMDLD
ncbi:alpha-1A adrenergic receptor-like [Diadema antillarum]|uniref:alpha-1A adrenergic receptor-like n=1 Tax=Diadema antillarum TaxID=105358 RepID=UPI003A876A23